MQHPELHQRIHDSFMRQGMMQHLEAKLIRVVQGEVEIALPYGDKVTQQQGGFHGGDGVALVVGGRGGARHVVDFADLGGRRERKGDAMGRAG